MRLTGTTIVLAILFAVSSSPFGVADDHRDPSASCGAGAAGVTMDTIIISSGGETLYGCYAYAASGKSAVSTLVVFVHGLGWTMQAGWTQHMIEIVSAHSGAAVVGVNFRDNFGFPTLQGAEDTVRATQFARADLAAAGAVIDSTIMYAVSMGAAIGGTAIHIAPGMNGGEGLYDHWIDVEGVSMVAETWAEARAVGFGIPFAKAAADGIERDAGGSPLEVPDAYVLRSPALNAEAMKAAGLRSAVVVHAVNDGLVPYDQGREMANAFARVGVPVEMYTILRGASDHTSGTTPTGHAGQPALDPNEQMLHFAGHASEGDGAHIVMRTGLDRLHALLTGSGVVGVSEHLVDADLGSFSLP